MGKCELVLEPEGTMAEAQGTTASFGGYFESCGRFHKELGLVLGDINNVWLVLSLTRDKTSLNSL